jgi:lycopene cyclase-like protein
MAAAMAPTGLSVALVSPNPKAVWENTYGIWADQVDESVSALLGGTSPFAQVFTTVNAIGDYHQNAKRAYGRIDNQVLHDALHASATSGTLTVKKGTAVGVEHSPADSSVTLADGKTLRATLVLDGSGASSPFVTRPTPSVASASQVAFGIVADFAEPPLPDNVCTLMDWRGPNSATPSFAYTLPLADGWLVEETSLASRPAISFEELERRLHARIQKDGLRITKIHRVERVLFPMDLPLPERTQRVVGLGAVASIVHPATGYSVAASLRLAPKLATSLVHALGAPGATPRTAALAAWKTIWPNDRMKARGLETYGLERVLTMDQNDTRQFFDSFFKLDVRTTSTYLGGEAGSAEMAAVMWKVFRNVSPKLQRRLATGNPLTLARTLLR